MRQKRLMSLKQLLGRQVLDCAIIGGGPVGLIFAILSRTSIGNVQIFESKEHDSTNQDNRALALSNGSRLILEEIGVWDRLEKKITKIKKCQNPKLIKVNFLNQF